MSDFQYIILEREGEWATLWLNRPEVRNALSDEVIDELHRAVDEVGASSDIRGLIVRGKGAVFCAGGDLKGFQKNFQASRTHEQVVAHSTIIGELFYKFTCLPQATIFLLHGAAVAGGLGMACAGDMIIATRETKMGLSETAIGIVPAQIAPLIVNRIGETKARYIMLTAKRFTAEQGADFGLVDFIVDDMGDAEAILATLQDEIQSAAPCANAGTKKLLAEIRHHAHKDVIPIAATAFADSVRSEEGREGVASFLEKRKPKWAE